MRLVTLAQYRDLVYAPGAAPSITTMRKRIKEIPGGRVELGRYYVDLDESERLNGLRQKNDEKRENLKANPLLAGLI
jgi:hypothetical protein